MSDSDKKSDEELERLAGNITVSDAEDSVLHLLAEVLEARKIADPDESYVASLYSGGTELIARKIGEESIETVLAAVSGEKSQIVNELADLWFHSLVLLVQQGMGPDDVLDELRRRFGISGIKEKASRQT